MKLSSKVQNFEKIASTKLFKFKYGLKNVILYKEYGRGISCIHQIREIYESCQRLFYLWMRLKRSNINNILSIVLQSLKIICAKL